MRVSEAAPRSIRPIAAQLAALGLLAFALDPANAQFRGQGPQNAPEEDPTYEWSAVLVSLDQGSRTAVVRAPVATHAVLDNVEEFSAGDRVVLIWSGRISATAVYDLAVEPELAPGMLSLPVEFVSLASDDGGQYVDFRINVPAESVATLASFVPGHRITGISPEMATEWNTSVESLRHYNDVS
jgi:hypothetical protein